MRENGREATAGRSFSYYTYGAAAALMHSLASEHPSIVSLSTTQATSNNTHHDDFPYRPRLPCGAAVRGATGGWSPLSLCPTCQPPCPPPHPQATFGLPPVGTCRDEHGSEGPCLNHVLEITNRTGGAAARRYRPQIYISGALHGDEQVPPASLQQ